jgi:hypothetical protein
VEDRSYPVPLEGGGQPFGVVRSINRPFPEWQFSTLGWLVQDKTSKAQGASTFVGAPSSRSSGLPPRSSSSNAVRPASLRSAIGRAAHAPSNSSLSSCSWASRSWLASSGESRIDEWSGLPAGFGRLSKRRAIINPMPNWKRANAPRGGATSRTGADLAGFAEV